MHDCGCNYVILGHSERRVYFKETNIHIKKCSISALKASLTPIICVGESLDHRKNNEALKFIETQVKETIPSTNKDIYIAYEPIWSIGTGSIPKSTEIYEMHNHIKKISRSILKYEVKVLYGGSVNQHNVEEILNVGNVDGILIGGASLKIKEFLAIYNSVVKHIINKNEINK